jgi:hypothetical protein
MFPVRAQAAISLGSVQSEPQVIRVLSDALSDSHPAVRAAAARSLERQGDPTALPALRAATRDQESAVRHAAESAIRALERVARTQPQTQPLPNGGRTPPSGADRFYVAVGRPGTTVSGISGGTLDSAQQIIRTSLGGMSGVRLAPPSEPTGDAQRILRSDSLVGYYLDSSIASVEERPGGGLRASVSVVVQSYPDRNIRSMLNGAATVMGASGETARRQAIEGALRAALRNLPQAMEASAGSAQANSGSPGGGEPRRRRR